MIPPALVRAVRDLGREMPGAAAIFDADGTLWREDIGEAFLRHLVGLGWVRLSYGGDPYAEYERRVQHDKPSGYAFAAQLQKGLDVQEVQGEAERFAASWVGRRLVGEVQELRRASEEAGLVPRVISASPLPIVLAAAPLAGVPANRCRGIEVRVRDGRFTDETVPPITYAEGKVAACASFGRIALGCGDSFTGDLALLSEARLPVVVAPRGGSPLAEEAVRRGWSVLAQDR